jgi:hypothetical protein
MYDQHWSDEQLIDRLYGVGPENNHLEVCRHCARRWQEIRRRYENLGPYSLEVSEEDLALQRRAFQNRLEGNRYAFLRVLVPVIATFLLVVFLFRIRPESESQPVMKIAGDTQFFEEVFQSVSDTEPAAFEPIRALFEVPQ